MEPPCAPDPADDLLQRLADLARAMAEEMRAAGDTRALMLGALEREGRRRPSTHVSHVTPEGSDNDDNGS